MCTTLATLYILLRCSSVPRRAPDALPRGWRAPACRHGRHPNPSRRHAGARHPRELTSEEPKPSTHIRPESVRLYTQSFVLSPHLFLLNPPKSEPKKGLYKMQEPATALTERFGPGVTHAGPLLNTAAATHLVASSSATSAHWSAGVPHTIRPVRGQQPFERAAVERAAVPPLRGQQPFSTGVKAASPLSPPYTSTLTHTR